MATEMKRITISVPDDLNAKIETYWHGNKMRNQTQAIISLINLGFSKLTGEPIEKLPQFTEDEIQLIKEYREAVPMARDMAHTTLRSYPVEKEHLA